MEPKETHTMKRDVVAPVILACLPMLLGGCAILGGNQADYAGLSYVRTDHVDVFFEEDAVERPHIIMGRAIAASASNSIEELYRDVLRKAMERGADAVLITDTLREQRYDHDGTVENQIYATYLKYR